MRNIKKLSTSLLLASAACLALTACTYQKNNGESDAVTQDTVQISETASADAAPESPVQSLEPLPGTPTTAGASNATSSETSGTQESTETPSSESASASKTESKAAAASTETSTATKPAPADSTVPMDGLVEKLIATDVSMQSPIFKLSTAALSTAVNNDIVAQNTTLLQQYAAAYPAVKIEYEHAFIDSRNILYVSFTATFQSSEAPETGVKHFSRNYDLNKGGEAIRVVGYLYSAQDIASALLAQNLDTHHTAGAVDASLWESQKAFLKNNDAAALTSQLAAADFGSDNSLATITITRTSNQTLTIYYPVPHSIGDYAIFTIGVLS